MAAGVAAWRGEGEDPGRGEGTVLGEVGILAGKAGRQDTHPAGTTFPGDLQAKKGGRILVFFEHLSHRYAGFVVVFCCYCTPASLPAVRSPRWACPSSP